MIITFVNQNGKQGECVGVFSTKYESFETLREFIEPNLEDGQDLEDAYSDCYIEESLDQSDSMELTEEEKQSIFDEFAGRDWNAENYNSAANKIAKFADENFNFATEDGSWNQLCEFDNPDERSYIKNGLYFGSDIDNQCGIKTFLTEGGFE